MTYIFPPEIDRNQVDMCARACFGRIFMHPKEGGVKYLAFIYLE